MGHHASTPSPVEAVNRYLSRLSQLSTAEATSSRRISRTASALSATWAMASSAATMRSSTGRVGSAWRLGMSVVLLQARHAALAALALLAHQLGALELLDQAVGHLVDVDVDDVANHETRGFV